jgi:hypothetical protein
MFTVLSCFEVALRTKFDKHYTAIYGNNWLRNAAAGGFLITIEQGKTKRKKINEEATGLNLYTHFVKLVAELNFGF